jgi:signal transduction histidine kinase
MLRLLRSASVRLTLVFAGLFVVAALILAGLLWWSTGAYLERETDAVIAADIQAIGDRLRDFGLPGAVSTIQERVAETADEHAIYLLTDPTLTPVAGNLSAWPAAVGPEQGWYQAALVRDGRPYAARLLHVSLRGGFQLLVGRDIQSRLAIRALILNALGWATLAALILAIGGGLLVRRAVLARIAQVNRTTAAIVQGDLRRRLPAPDDDDEFGRLALTINEMLAQIELLVEGVRNASNAVAHDLRTPLAELRAHLEGIGRGSSAVAIPDAVRGALADAIADVDRLVAMCNALLRLAEIDSGARRAGFAKVALAHLVAEVAEIYAALAEEKGATLTVDAAAAIEVTGDPDMLAQAVGNLLDNAVKYAPTGRIALTLGRRSDGRATIVVADNGPGIPAAERDKAVERFYRGDASRSSPGHGLGLAEVAAVAKLHGGTLELADNAPGLKATLVLGST